jgi:methylthioribose-1-phosphate isomerase
MKYRGRHYRSIEREGDAVLVIDQARLPHEFVQTRLATLESVAQAIRHLTVRGAPLIGVTAAYGLAIALRSDSSNDSLRTAQTLLLATRPTARNLSWALRAVSSAVANLKPEARADAAWAAADALAEADIATNLALARHGSALLRTLWEERGRPARLDVATHCNAGWLACVDWGTALAALYMAHDEGVPVHVWVDETRPVNQGARLTAWELGAHGVPYTLQVDGASGYRLQHGIAACLVGADRVTAQGDVCNKIGTYLLALAARDNGIPFYVSVPSSTFDPTISRDDIEIEERPANEVTHVWGRNDAGAYERVQVAPADAPVGNPAFDVTPARLVSALITERGVFSPGEAMSSLSGTRGS